MKYYKDTKGSVHILSDRDVLLGGESLLPKGCIEISEAEAIALLTPSAEETAERLAVDGRLKRNMLLIIADRLINTLEDSGGSAHDLRAWRVALRDWPASPGFPSISTIPPAPPGTIVPEDAQAQIDEILN